MPDRYEGRSVGEVLLPLERFEEAEFREYSNLPLLGRLNVSRFGRILDTGGLNKLQRLRELYSEREIWTDEEVIPHPGDMLAVELVNGKEVKSFIGKFLGVVKAEYKNPWWNLSSVMVSERNIQRFAVLRRIPDDEHRDVPDESQKS